MRLPIDLHALVLSAVAVSPFAAWTIAATLFDAVTYGDDIATVITDLADLALSWMTWIVGIVVVSVGGALLLQGRSERLHPFAMTCAALVIVALILFVESVTFGLRTLQLGLQYPSRDTLIELTNYFMRATSLLVSVVVASRLYLSWRSASPDPKDGRRFIVLGAIALALAASTSALWIAGMLSAMSSLSSQEVSIPDFVLSCLNLAVSNTAEYVGRVFLFGFAAMALLRRAQADSDLRWATVASAGAVLAFGITQGLIGALVAWWTTPNLVELNWPAITRGLLVAVFGGAFYLFVVERAAFRQAMAGMPQRIAAVRQWPHRPSEDE